MVSRSMGNTDSAARLSIGGKAVLVGSLCVLLLWPPVNLEKVHEGPAKPGDMIKYLRTKCRLRLSHLSLLCTHRITNVF